ncbi:VPLPA-CTERM sorting domain-containing protein [Rhodobacteraceae bacterium SC52]|nr:VPLPA-CTERM sorting domain-containing protein [Rhodobacteraceae bacterium SC52]
MRKLLFLCFAACAAPVPVLATTYTYAIDYTFPILREGNQLGAYADPIPGRGSVKGEIVLDDNFLTSRTLISYSLTTTNSSTRSNVENMYSFSSDDPNETFTFRAASSYWDPHMYLVFSDQSYAQPCSASSPVGPRGTYSIAGSTLTLEIDKNFTPGDAGFSMQALELFGRTAYCAGVGFPLFEHEHTAPNGSGVIATLTSTGTGTTATVPLPAGLPLLVGGVAVLGVTTRRRKAHQA